MKLPSLQDVLDLISDEKSIWYADPEAANNTPEYLAYFESVRHWLVYEYMAMHWDLESVLRPLTAQEAAAYSNVVESAHETRRCAALTHWGVLRLMNSYQR